MSRLQQDLRAQILGWAHAQALLTGERLNEARLAERLGVSRTPLRAALALLEQEGVVIREPYRGVRLVKLPAPSAPSPLAPITPNSTDEDTLLVRIARDRGRSLLGSDVTETDLARRYGVGRPVVRAALDRLADLGMVAHKPGYGWRFTDTLHDLEARAQSYRFRIIIETAAILEPGFALPTAWADVMRARHQRALADRWTPTSSVAFFEMNAAFHEGIAAASGNRYLHASVVRQNRLRRLSNYHWRHGIDRVVVNCQEHLGILDQLEQHAFAAAADAMRRHLETASHLQPSFVTSNGDQPGKSGRSCGSVWSC